MTKEKLNQKIGILGGGQLGKMLCQAGSKFGLQMNILEKDLSYPAAQVCQSFKCGDITNFEDVINFGKNLDIITIEIENVNIEALDHLEKIGKKIFPPVNALKIIRDKAKQKMFFEASNLPTSEFAIYKDKQSVIQDINSGKVEFPFIQKSRTDGYDGKGVQVISDKNDIGLLLDGPCIIEEKVDIDKEIAVIVAINPTGDICTYPVVEMHFHPTANLVEYLFCPSKISEKLERDAKLMATDLAKRLNMVGLLAVEMFVNKKGEMLINEVAPRPHNSGHHTIEACVTSQYEMHLRAILDLPLGSTELIRPAVMVNLLGEPGYSGAVVYQNLDKCLELDGVYPHLYGKSETKPYRKMGHVTIVDKNLVEAIRKGEIIKEILKVVA